MQTSAALIVKKYLEKYTVVNTVKTKKLQYTDPGLARKTLSVAFDIIHEMESLIKSNEADNFTEVKKCLKCQVAVMQAELRKRQSLIKWIFQKPKLPFDFGKCVHEAWFRVQHLEKHFNQ